jgi:hypothetical protein
MPPGLQSVLAVAGGFVLTVVGVMLGTLLAVAALLPKPAPGEPVSPTATYLVANLLVSMAAAVLGGYGAAYFAGRSPLFHSGPWQRCSSR